MVNTIEIQIQAVKIGILTQEQCGFAVGVHDVRFGRALGVEQHQHRIASLPDVGAGSGSCCGGCCGCGERNRQPVGGSVGPFILRDHHPFKMGDNPCCWLPRLRELRIACVDDERPNAKPNQKNHTDGNPEF